MLKVALFRCPQSHEFDVATAVDDPLLDMKCEQCKEKATWKRVRYVESDLDRDGNDGHILVKNQEYRFGKWNVPNIGRFHRTDAQQDQLYGKRIRHARQVAAERRKSTSKKDDVQWEHVGRMPLEMHESIVENENNRHAVQRDPETWLKKTGCWIGE